MDRARRLRGLRSTRHGPGARFLGADGEEGDEAKQFIARPDDPRETRFGKAQRFEIFRPFLDRHGDEFRLNGGGDDYGLGIFRRGLFEHTRRMSVAARCAIFLDIADIEDGLGGQQLRLREQPCFFFVARHRQARGLAVAQQV